MYIVFGWRYLVRRACRGICWRQDLIQVSCCTSPYAFFPRKILKIAMTLQNRVAACDWAQNIAGPHAAYEYYFIVYFIIFCSSALEVEIEDSEWPSQQFEHYSGKTTWSSERWILSPRNPYPQLVLHSNCQASSLALAYNLSGFNMWA